MTKFERLLASGSMEMPDCQCGVEMRFTRSKQADKSPGIEVRVYECPACGHELRLTVWADVADPVAVVEGL
jgi:peptide subunit release factor 1 (eRF1)